MASKKDTEARIAQLRKRIAETEATLGDYKEKLARLLATTNPSDVAAISGLDLLWKAALPKCRERSSRHQCRVAWHRIPKDERPPIDQAVAALKAWNRCEEWTRDRGQFAPALHRYIAERRWEDVPQVTKAPSPYRPAPKAPAPASTNPDDYASPEEIRRILGLAASCEE
jgi:hypothetical protein